MLSGPIVVSGSSPGPTRAVPRDDRPDDADRLADDQAELPFGRLGRLLERERAGQVGERVEGGLRADPAEAAIACSTPDSCGHIWPMSSPPPDELGTDGPQVPSPFGMSQLRPGTGVERLPRGLDRP